MVTLSLPRWIVALLLVSTAGAVSTFALLPAIAGHPRVCGAGEPWLACVRQWAEAGGTAFAIIATLFEPGEEHGVTVSLPDLPEAITQGDDEADARAMAEEVLGLALLARIGAGAPLPEPKARGRTLVAVTVDPAVAAKLAVIEAIRASGLTQAALAARLGKDGREIRRNLDPDHPTKLPALDAALKALGQRLVMGVMAA